MLRHPAGNYIAYLFSKRGLSTAQIIEELDDLRFPLPRSNKELARFTVHMVKMRQAMEIPEDFDPRAEKPNDSTTRFLTQWKIWDMWRGDEFVARAIDLLNEPAMRRMTEALLLGPLSPQSIADRVSQRFGLSLEVINVRVIKAFQHYFWNVSALNISEWRGLIDHWLPEENNNDYLAALGAPRSAAGAALVLAIVDRSADSLTPVQQYTAFRDHGFNVFMEHALLQSKPSLPRTQAMFMAFQMTRMADEELTKHRGGSADLLDEFKKIQTTYDHSKLATVKDIPTLAPAIEATFVEEPAPETTEDQEIA